jgi:hypothetical protein
MSPAWRRTQLRFAFLHPDFPGDLRLISNHNNHGVGNNFSIIVYSWTNNQISVLSIFWWYRWFIPKKQQCGRFVILSELAWWVGEIWDSEKDQSKISRTPREQWYHSAKFSWFTIATGWSSLWQATARSQTTCPVAVVTIKLGPSIVNGAVITQNLCTIDNSFQFIILYLLFNSHVACRDTKSRARPKYNFVITQLNRFHMKMILLRTYNTHCVGIRTFASGSFVL